MFKKNPFKISTCDINKFIKESRIYLLLLIVGFYIISRTLSIITVVANYSQEDVKVFWYKIIFHFVNMFTLIIALPAIKKDKQKITDRTELDEQIEKVYKGVEEKIYRTKSGKDLINNYNSAFLLE